MSQKEYNIGDTVILNVQKGNPFSGFNGEHLKVIDKGLDENDVMWYQCVPSFSWLGIEFRAEDLLPVSES